MLCFSFELIDFEKGEMSLRVEKSPPEGDPYFSCEASSLRDAWRKLLAESHDWVAPDTREREDLTLRGLSVHPELWVDMGAGLDDPLAESLEAEARQMGILSGATS